MPLETHFLCSKEDTTNIVRNFLVLLNPFTFHAPESVSEAIKLYSSLESAKIQAGGTFLLNNLKLLKRKGSKTPQHIISLRKVKDLKGVSEKGDVLTIGAMTTMSDLLASPLLKGNMDILKVAAKNVGTCAIRNMATIGGNLTCRYTWTEMPGVMVALEADLHFMGADSKEEIISAEDFYKAKAKTDKLFTHLTIKKDPKAKMVYRRIKKTPNVDIPMLSLLIKTSFDKGQFTNTCIGINNCVDFAQRDSKLEDFLNQSCRSENVAEESLGHLDEPIYDTRSSDYKKYIFRVSIKSAVTELIGE